MKCNLISLKKIFIPIFLIIFFIFTDAQKSYGGYIYAIQSGNWSAAATWEGGVIPGANDTVDITGILADCIVTLDIDATCKYIYIYDARPGGPTSYQSLLEIATGKTLNVNGDIFIQGLNTTNFSAIFYGTTGAKNGVINLDGNLFIDGTGAFFDMSATSGTLNISGNIDITNNGGALLTLKPCNSPALATDNSTINFNGNNPAKTQIIPLSNFANLKFSNSSPKKFTPDVNFVTQIAKNFDIGTSQIITTGSYIRFNGVAASGNQTIPPIKYYSLGITGARGATTVTLSPTGTIEVDSLFSYSATFTAGGSLINTGSTISYTGKSNQTISLGTNFKYNNLKVNKTNGSIAGTGTNLDSVNVNGDITVEAGTFFVPGRTLNGNRSNKLEVKNGARLLLGDYDSNYGPNNVATGGAAFPGGDKPFGTIILNPTSIVEYSSSNAQTIAAKTYGKLVSSGTGTRTLSSSGTIQIVDRILASGINSYTTTGSTVEFIGTGVNTQVVTGNLGSATNPFYRLAVNVSGTGGFGLNASTTVTKELILTQGAFYLIGQVLIIDSTATITRTGGGVICETTNNSGKIQRNIGSKLGTYVFPFGKDKDNYVPFIFQLTGGDAANISVSTYRTTADNTPLPTATPPVTEIDGQGATDAAGKVADRFWQIESSVPAGSRTANLTFTTTTAETMSIDNLKARRWNNTAWDPATAGQTSTRTSVTVPGATDFSAFAIYGDKLVVPLAAFTSNKESACTGEEIQYTDQSSPAATSWNWTFEGGTPATSIDQNPKVRYYAAGVFDVTLQANNASGTGIPLVKNNYITIQASPVATFTTDKNSICQNDSVKVSSTSTGTFNWTFNDAVKLSGSGAGPYDLKWNTNGTKSISLTVTENGCTSVPTTHQVTVNKEVSFTLSSTQATNCNSSDGTATATVTEGLSPYTYLWNDANAQVGQTATGLKADNYSVIVTDANQCKATKSIAVNAPGVPSSTFSIDKKTICFGDTVTVNYSGTPSATATYEWSFAGAKVVSGTLLGPGPYKLTWEGDGTKQITLKVSDQSCSSVLTEDAVKIGKAILLTLTSTNTTGCGSANGTATVVATDGISPYTYLWDDATKQTTATASNLLAGVYTVNVTDAKQCKSKSSIGVMDEGSTLTATVSGSSSVKCFGGADGSATASATGGTSPYNYSWNGASYSTNPTATGLKSGTYSVSIKDAAGCISTASKTITEPTLLVANAGKDTIICKDSLVVLQSSSSGGTAPYTYLWSNGKTTPEAEFGPVSANTTFNVIVQDANGCEATDLVSVDIKSCDIKPLADFDFQINQNTRTVTFTDKSTNLPLSWAWSFGDAENATDQNPAHTYAADGLFDVCLIATNTAGSNELCKKVDVKKTVGIGTLLMEQFMVYPNPANNRVYLSFDSKEPKEIIIMSIEGRKLIGLPQYDAGGINIDALPEGFYIIYAYGKNTVLTGKMQVIR